MVYEIGESCIQVHFAIRKSSNTLYCEKRPCCFVYLFGSVTAYSLCLIYSFPFLTFTYRNCISTIITITTIANKSIMSSVTFLKWRLCAYFPMRFRVPCAICIWCFMVDPRFASLKCNSISQHSLFVHLVHMHSMERISCECWVWLVVRKRAIFHCIYAIYCSLHIELCCWKKTHISIAFEPLRSQNTYKHFILTHFKSFFRSHVFASFTVLQYSFLLFSLYIQLLVAIWVAITNSKPIPISKIFICTSTNASAWRKKWCETSRNLFIMLRFRSIYVS